MEETIVEKSEMQNGDQLILHTRKEPYYVLWQGCDGDITFEVEHTIDARSLFNALQNVTGIIGEER